MLFQVVCWGLKVGNFLTVVWRFRETPHFFFIWPVEKLHAMDMLSICLCSYNYNICWPGRRTGVEVDWLVGGPEVTGGMGFTFICQTSGVVPWVIESDIISSCTSSSSPSSLSPSSSPSSSSSSSPSPVFQLVRQGNKMLSGDFEKPVLTCLEVGSVFKVSATEQNHPTFQ